MLKKDSATTHCRQLLKVKLSVFSVVFVCMWLVANVVEVETCRLIY
jgi:hypothetical protein